MSTAEDIAGAKETIEAIRNAYRSRDVETLLSYFTKDAHVIGTKSGESWTRRDDLVRAIRSDFGLPEIKGQLSATELDPEVHVVGELAWTVMEGRFELGPRSHLGRWTCLLRNIDGEWRVIHSHFSVPEGVKTP